MPYAMHYRVMNNRYLTPRDRPHPVKAAARCHGSRYDRLGIKVDKLVPAPRGLDRFASIVDGDGVLTIDTSKITLGPLPIALGQPGVIPRHSPVGCL